MIQRSDARGSPPAEAGAFDAGATGPADPLAWRDRFDLSEVAFATVWATGGDVERDAVFRLQALRREPSGWTSFDRHCRPFAGAPGDGPVTARMARDFGVRAEDLEGAREPADAWRELEAFLQDAPRVVLDRGTFDAWRARFSADGEHAGAPAVDPADLSALWTPGRGRADVEALARELAVRPRGGPRAIGPADLLEVVAALAESLHDGPHAALALIGLGYGGAWARLEVEDPQAAARLALSLALLESPSAWIDGSGRLFPARAPLPDAALTSAAEEAVGLGPLMAAVRPGWQVAAHAWMHADPVPPTRDDAEPLDGEDVAAVERVFTDLLPRELGRGDAASYRSGQHGVARELAAHFGRGELFLAHAPTGTGKTLAYLVPALLWAARRDVRVGVATYTRALQEQAMRHDVPIALRLLHEVRPDVRPRVGLLKGRANYLCWRALQTLAPGPRDGGGYRLSWTALALFAVGDTEGDLDRFPMRPPLRAHERSVLREHAALVRSVRAAAECCTGSEDRASCAADVARRRAERSHVVVTNQSFALARQEFFRHLVFDECEHLHEQAHQAWSRFFDPRATRDLVLRLARPGPGASVLGRLAGAAIAASSHAGALVREALDRASGAREALARLEDAIAVFERWRERARAGRLERDQHTLLREYVASGESAELRRAHAELGGELVGLGAALAGLSGIMDEIPVRGRGRLRRSLDLARAELEERTEAFLSWMPRPGGEVRLAPEIFYDVETDPGGRTVLATRVLLPHEHLGRHYLPSLEGAAFLSATTWLRDGFEASAQYLGVARAAAPAPEEEREPCEVRAYRAPETFDYGRVVVAVPRDAPPVTADKSGFLDYVRRFVTHLAERTRGRCLVLFTNADDCARVGRALERPFSERLLAFWYQRMEGTGKEELGELFRSRVDSVLLGLDTFWFGADFPGETLEYLVIVRLPYGVPDRYHHAQCAVLGREEQRNAIYLPRALAKFRQGFGRLMRKETDRGCVFLLDGRVLDPRHRLFLKELPLRSALDEGSEGARLVQGDTDRCVHEALAHMGMLADVRRRGLDAPFAAAPPPPFAEDAWTPPTSEPAEHADAREEDLPF